MKDLKYLIIFSLTLCMCSRVNAANIVYPKTTTAKINSPVTFFIGNEKPDKKLKINGEEVTVHPSGGFYHVVKLNDGNNVFTIDNGNSSETKTYTIIKPIIKETENNQEYVPFDNDMTYITIADSVPLRAFANESGQGRLQHLQKGIPLNIIGEQAGYYKTKLARDDYAWIDKKYVFRNDNFDNSPAKILSYDYEENIKDKTFTIKLDKKEPFILSETKTYKVIDNNYETFATGLDLTIYNMTGYPENKYELHISSDSILYGYKAFYNDANELIIKVKKHPKVSRSYPLKGVIITLDPGHGGDEFGAIGCLGDNEKDINLKFALEIKKALEKVGATVYLTRDNDSEIGLYDRVKFSQEKNSDIFISIHQNALPDSQAESMKSGTGVYYFYPQSAQLANTILKVLTKNLSMNNDKVHQESFAVVRNPESLSILVEIGYIINPDDNAKLINHEFHKKTANAFVKALEKYYVDQQN